MRSRRLPQPPPALADHLSRREVARLLGFASDFPVRRLEQEGALQAVRGAMGQAWYPRAQVVALAETRASGRSPAVSARTSASASPVPPSEGGDSTRGAGARWPDAALIARLRELVPATGEGTVRPRTVVDLVADTGIGIARAVRVHRFWLRHDLHPTAELARRLAHDRVDRLETIVAGGDSPHRSAGALTLPVAPKDVAAKSGERRAQQRLERDGLIRKLRDPDPAIRARAFEKLRPGRAP